MTPAGRGSSAVSELCAPGRGCGGGKYPQL